MSKLLGSNLQKRPLAGVLGGFPGSRPVVAALRVLARLLLRAGRAPVSAT